MGVLASTSPMMASACSSNSVQQFQALAGATLLSILQVVQLAAQAAAGKPTKAAGSWHSAAECVSSAHKMLLQARS